MKPKEWASYCEKLSNDPLAPAGSVIVARILRHTGADVGEVLGYCRRDDKQWVPGIIVKDLLTQRKLPRIRLRRQKVKSAKDRLVPYPERYLPELLEYVKDNNLGDHEPLFRAVERTAFEAAHRRATRAIGRDDLRLKDFRHLAAIAWAQGDVRIERVKEWLGHSTIRLSEIYSRFAPDDALDEPAAERAADLADGATGGRQLRAS